MKEYTITYNAAITDIIKEQEETEETILSDLFFEAFNPRDKNAIRGRRCADKQS